MASRANQDPSDRHPPKYDIDEHGSANQRIEAHAEEDRQLRQNDGHAGEIRAVFHDEGGGQRQGKHDENQHKARAMSAQDTDEDPDEHQQAAEGIDQRAPGQVLKRIRVAVGDNRQQSFPDRARRARR